MLALYTCSLTANVAVEVMVRAAAGVSVRAAARVAARAAVRVAARNKLMRLIGSRLLSQLSVAQSTVSLAMWLALGGDASLVVGVVTVRVVTLESGLRLLNVFQPTIEL